MVWILRVHDGLRLLNTNDTKEINDLAAQASSLVTQIAHIYPVFLDGLLEIFYQSISHRPKFHNTPPIVVWPQGGCWEHVESTSQSRGQSTAQERSERNGLI